MRVVLLGVRGSTPAPGADFVRYGGHTSCVAVLRDGEDEPALVLDAGTGLRDLGGLLGAQPFRGAIVLTHLHWDHVHGLPFTPAVDRPDARVELHVPVPVGGGSAVELLARAMSPPHFPIGPDGLRGAWRFHAARPGSLEVAGFAVTVAEICHGGGLTYGIRVDGDGGSLAYLPDHAPADGSEPAEALADEVDLLVHDAQFTDAERAVADNYRHSTITDALDFAKRCAARRLVLTHHSPGRTDNELDELASCLGARSDVLFARQGDTVPVPAYD